MTNLPQSQLRDFQRYKVYRAENLTSQLKYGNFWKQTLTEEEVLDLLNYTLSHPNIIARWGQKNITVRFDKDKRRESSAGAFRTSGLLVLSPEACNPMIVLHELGHLFATKTREPFHGAGFCAIMHYLFTHVLGDEFAKLLLSAYNACGVQVDYEQILPVRKGAKLKNKWDIAGVSVSEPGEAAKTIRAAINSGLFNDDEELKEAAKRISRKLDSADAHVPEERIKSPSIPSIIRIDVAALGDYERHDFLEAVFNAVRDTNNTKKVRHVKVDYASPVLQEVESKVVKKKVEKGKAMKIKKTSYAAYKYKKPATRTAKPKAKVKS